MLVALRWKRLLRCRTNRSKSDTYASHRPWARRNGLVLSSSENCSTTQQLDKNIRGHLQAPNDRTSYHGRYVSSRRWFCSQHWPGVSLVISNGLNKARSRPLVLDTLISDIEYAFSYDHCFCRWPQSKRPVKHVEKLSTRRTWDYSQVETHCDPTQANASFGLLVAHYPAT